MTDQTPDKSHHDISSQMQTGGETHQKMRGFDAEFVDIVDYITCITHRIWEERKTGTIYQYYLDNAVIHTPAGDIQGVETVVANTIQTLSVFPDRRLFADDIIWSGNDEEGFYTSHRITSTGTHLGFSHYGPPTGRKLRFLGIADCLVKDNRIHEEWLVRDNLSIIQQIGLDVDEFVAMLADAKAGKNALNDVAPGSPHPQAQIPPAELPAIQPNFFEPEDFVKRTWHDIWNRRMFNTVYDNYSATCRCHSSSGREYYGHEDQVQFAIDWLACFPDGKMDFNHFCCLGDSDRGYRAALRWTFTGTHNGYGLYGPPTGKQVVVMGISHQNIQNGQFVEEWTVFDELDLLVQLHQPQAAGNNRTLIGVDPDSKQE